MLPLLAANLTQLRLGFFDKFTDHFTSKIDENLFHKVGLSDI